MLVRLEGAGLEATDLQLCVKGCKCRRKEAKLIGCNFL